MKNIRIAATLLLAVVLSISINAQSLDVKWKFNANDKITATPIVEGTSLYIGAESGVFYALDTETGKELWQFKTRGYIMAKATIHNDIVFFESSNVFYALDKNTGKELWKYDLEWPVWGYKIDHWDDIHSSAIVHNDIFYVGTSLGAVIGLNASDGHPVLVLPKGIRAPIRSTPVVHNNNIYFGDWNGKVYCHSLATKEIVWEKPTYSKQFYTTFGGIASEMLVHNDKLYFGARNPQLSVLKTETGEPAWVKNENDSTGGWIIGAPVIYDNILYMGNSDSHELHAMNADTGEEIWNFDTGLNVYTKPVVDENEIILTAGNAYWYFEKQKKEVSPLGGLFVIDRKTGALISKFEMAEPCFSSAVVQGNTIFFGSFDGNVYAVEH